MRSASTAQFRSIAWLLGAVLSASCLAQPDNDDFARRLPVSGRAPVFTAYLLDASLEPGEPTHGTSTLTARKSAWWTWTAPFSGYLTLVATSQNTSVGGLALYTGETVTALTRVGEVAPGLLAVSEGATYQVAIWSSSEVSVPESGAYEGYVCVSWANDSFVAAPIYAGNPLYVDGSTRGTGREPGGEPVHGGAGSGPSAWWNWQPPVNGWAFAVGRGYAFPFSVGAYVGDDYPQLVPLGRRCGPDRWFWPVQSNAVCRVAGAGNGPEVVGTYQLHLAAADLRLASPSDGAHLRLGESISITFVGEAPGGPTTAYAIATDGEVRTWEAPTGQTLVVTNLPRGEYDLLVTVRQGEFEYPSAPVHMLVEGSGDVFAEAIPLASYHNEVTGDLAGTTLEPGEPPVPGERPGSLWWKWTAPVTGPVFLKPDARVLTEVFRGSDLTTLEPVALRTSQAVPGTWELLAAQGEVFHLRVAEGMAATRDVVLGLEAVEAAPNDDPSRAVVLSSPSGGVVVSNAAIENGTNLTTQSLWYRWQAAETGILEIVRTLRIDSDLDYLASVTVFREAPTVAGEVAKLAVGSLLRVQVEAGLAYWLAVANPGALPGECHHLEYRMLLKPGNDDYANRLYIDGASAGIGGTLLGATKTGKDDRYGAWWTWRAPASGTATITLTGPGSDLLVAVPNAVNGSAAPTPDQMALERVSWNYCFAAEAGKAYDIHIGAITPTLQTEVRGLVTLTQSIIQPNYGEDRVEFRLQGYAAELDGEPVKAHLYNLSDIGYNPGPCPCSYPIGILTNVYESNLAWTTRWPFAIYAAVVNSAGEIRVTPTVSGSLGVIGNDLFAKRTRCQGGTFTASDSSDYSTYDADDARRNLPYSPDYGTLWYSWIAPSDGNATIIAGGTYHTFYFAKASSIRMKEITWQTSTFPVLANTEYVVAVLGRNRQNSGGDFGNACGFTLTHVEANPPQLKLTLEEPQPSRRWYVNAPVRLVASMADQPAGFQSVELAVGKSNGHVNWTHREPPFESWWTPTEPGDYQIKGGIRLTNGMWYPLVARNLTVYSENDDFDRRITWEGNRVTSPLTPLLATLEPDEPRPDPSFSSGSLWWRWVAPQSGPTIVFATVPEWAQLAAIRMAAYEGDSLAGLPSVASTASLKLAFDAVAGHEYAIQAQPLIQYGSPTLTLQQLPNDHFADRLQFEGEHVQTTGDNLHCTREYLEPRHAGRDGGRSLWYAWRAPARGEVTLALSGTILTNLLAVYTGSSVEQLSPVAGNATTGTNQVVFPVHAGQDYAIAIDGEFGATGDFILQLNLAPMPPVTLSLVSRSDLGTTLRVTGTQGSTVTLLYSDDLSAWATLETRPATTTESLEFVDHTASPNGQRFYRAELRAAP